ncbi:MAG: hypothetical protein ACRC10_04485 [Thermoguttaceae bacterium]
MKKNLLIAVIWVGLTTVLWGAEPINWSVVRDDTLLFRSEERPLLWSLLTSAKNNSLDVSNPVCVTSLQLEAQSEEYRGKPVVVSGQLIGVGYTALQNIGGNRKETPIAGLYNFWVRLPDNPTKPILLLSTEPVEDQILGREIEAVGIYLKRQLTSNGESLITVPTIFISSFGIQSESEMGNVDDFVEKVQPTRTLYQVQDVLTVELDPTIQKMTVEQDATIQEMTVELDPTNWEKTVEQGLTNREETVERGLTNQEETVERDSTNQEKTVEQGLTNREIREKSFVSELLGYDLEIWNTFEQTKNPAEFPKNVVAKGLARLQQQRVALLLREQAEKVSPTLLSSCQSGIPIELTQNVVLQRIEPIDLSPEQTESFGFARFFLGILNIDDWEEARDDSKKIIVLTPTVPQKLPFNKPLNEPVRLSGILLRTQPNPVLLANRLEWYPTTLLGQAGMDVATLDQVRVLPIQQIFGETGETSEETTGERGETAGEKRGPNPSINRQELYAALRLTEQDREPFYQMLDASSKISKVSLQAEVDRELQQQGRNAFSVVNLFNNPPTQKGRLVRLRGIARRIDPVFINEEDIQRRLGVDRYYQVIFFTEDSQDNPLVLCVKDVPPNLPLGAGPDFRVELELSAFFFKTWAYEKRGNDESGESNWQFAPLLIGQIDGFRPLDDDRTHPKGHALLYKSTFLLITLVIVWIVLRRIVRKKPTRFRSEPTN